MNKKTWKYNAKKNVLFYGGSNLIPDFEGRVIDEYEAGDIHIRKKSKIIDVDYLLRCFPFKSAVSVYQGGKL